MDTTRTVTTKFLEELQGNGSQALLLIDMIRSGEISIDSFEFRERYDAINRKNQELYGAFIRTMDTV